MKRLLIPVLAAALGAAAVPALAQPGRDNIHAREASIAQLIDDGVMRGQLSRPEAQRLRSELRSIQQLEFRYRHDHGYRYGYREDHPEGGGLSPAERADLNRRLDDLSRQISFHRRYAPIYQ
jgi:hypothetical protein